MRALLLLAFAVLILAYVASAVPVPRKGKFKNDRDTPQMAKLRREMMMKRRGMAGVHVEEEGDPEDAQNNIRAERMARGKAQRDRVKQARNKPAA
jgi:hypothetical protein